jgi:diamine N-acetyltransferase
MNETPPISRDSAVTLREVTADTLRQICDLSVAEHQQQYVAPNVVSIAQAYFSKEAWFRAIYADDTPVGFLMLHDDEPEAKYFLWRYMIDHRYQKFGFGRHALELLMDHVRTRPGATELLLSCVPGPDGPENFYRKLGFAPTGDMHGSEMEMKIKL